MDESDESAGAGKTGRIGSDSLVPRALGASHFTVPFDKLAGMGTL
jgi:hypothetical protein